MVSGVVPKVLESRMRSRAPGKWEYTIRRRVWSWNPVREIPPRSGGCGLALQAPSNCAPVLGVLGLPAAPALLRLEVSVRAARTKTMRRTRESLRGRCLGMRIRLVNGWSGIFDLLLLAGGSSRVTSNGMQPACNASAHPGGTASSSLAAIGSCYRPGLVMSVVLAPPVG